MGILDLEYEFQPSPTSMNWLRKKAYGCPACEKKYGAGVPPVDAGKTPPPQPGGAEQAPPITCTKKYLFKRCISEVCKDKNGIVYFGKCRGQANNVPIPPKAMSAPKYRLFTPNPMDKQWVNAPMAQGYYPDPSSPDWIHHYGAIDETVPYGYEGKTVPVYADAYGVPNWFKTTPNFPNKNIGVNTGVRNPVVNFRAIDETVPYGYEGKTVPVYSDEYGADALPVIPVVCAVAGAVSGILLYNYYRKNKGGA